MQEAVERRKGPQEWRRECSVMGLCGLVYEYFCVGIGRQEFEVNRARGAGILSWATGLENLIGHLNRNMNPSG